jgi:hypothetical protein
MDQVAAALVMVCCNSQHKHLTRVQIDPRLLRQHRNWMFTRAIHKSLRNMFTVTYHFEGFMERLCGQTPGTMSEHMYHLDEKQSLPFRNRREMCMPVSNVMIIFGICCSRERSLIRSKKSCDAVRSWARRSAVGLPVTTRARRTASRLNAGMRLLLS